MAHFLEESDLEYVEDLNDSTDVGHGRWHDRHLKVSLKVGEASRCVSSDRRRLVLEHVVRHVLTQTQRTLVDPKLYVLRSNSQILYTERCTLTFIETVCYCECF